MVGSHKKRQTQPSPESACDVLPSCIFNECILIGDGNQNTPLLFSILIIISISRIFNKNHHNFNFSSSDKYTSTSYSPLTYLS